MSKRVIKETGTATALRIVFAIIITMTLYVFTNGLVMHNTIYNEDFLKSTVMSDEIRNAVVEEVSLEIKEYMISQASVDPSQLSDADIDEFYDVETGNEFADQMVDYTMDELIDIFLEGDTKIDEDRFDEIFDEYGEDFFDEVEGTGIEVSREDFLESKSELFDQINDLIDEVHDDADDSGVLEYIDISGARRSNTVSMAVSGSISIILLVVLILIHKNKFRPVRAFGIAATVTEVSSLIGWTIIWGMVTYGEKAADISDRIFKVLIKTGRIAIEKVMAIYGLASLVGVLLIIIGCVGTGIVNSIYRGKTETIAPTAPGPDIPKDWTCPSCGSLEQGKFCSNCGAKRS